jgi:glycosyltransferase involved in cell wall biosynthesis
MSQMPLNLLCVEPRFPGRLGAVADWLVRKRGYHCRFFCHAVEPRSHWPPAAGRGLDVIAFNVGGVARQPAVPWSRYLERGLCYAFGAFEVIDARRPRPIDLVLGRSAGLGSTLFVPVSLPRIPMVNLFDYYYHPRRHDLAPEFDPVGVPDYFAWRRTANAMDLLDLENGARPWVPTAWQRDLFPPEYRSDFTVLFDGVDAARFRRDSSRPRVIAGEFIPAGMRVVSFVARRLDRLRGFDRFAQLANRLLCERRDVLVVAAGGGPVERGLDVRHFGRDYAAAVLAREPPADPARFRLLGEVAPATVAELLTASDLHVYPSRPYSVARSLVEAMAAGCVILAADTEPVREFLMPGKTGLLVSPDDSEAALAQARAVLADPAAHRPLGEAAADLVRQRYAHDATLPALAAWFDGLVTGKRTPSRDDVFVGWFDPLLAAAK